MELRDHGDTIGYTISRNSLSNLAGTVVAVVVGVLLMPFIVDRIGPTKFGIWVLANSLVGYMGLLDAGLAPTLVKKAAEHLAKGEKEELNDTVSAILTIYLLMGLLAGVGMFCLSFLLSQVFNVPPHDSDSFRVVLWIVGFQAALSIPMSIWGGLLSSLQDFHIINGIVVLTNLIRAVATVILLMSGYGLISLIWLGFFVGVVGWIGGIFWTARRIPTLRIKISRPKSAKVKNLVRFSATMLLSGIAGRIIHGADRVLIGLFLPVASITIYEVGARIGDYTRTVLYSALSVIMPAASDLDARNEKAALQSLYLKGTRYLFMLVSAMVATLLVFGDKFIHLWMGNGYEQSVWVMYVLIIGNLYQSQNVVADAIVIGMGRLNAYTIAMASYPILTIILSVIVIPHWGLIGAAVATTLAIVVIETPFIIYMAKILQLRLPSLIRAFHLSTIVLVIPVVAIMYYARSILRFDSWLQLSLGTVASSILFLLAFVSFGVLKDDKEMLKRTACEVFRYTRLQKPKGRYDR